MSTHGEAGRFSRLLSGQPGIVEGMGTGAIAISPQKLALLLLWAVICGALLGVFYDIIRVSRVFLGVRYPGRAVDALLNKPLPFLHRTLSSGEGKKHPCRALIIFLQDILFGVTSGAVLCLLLFFCSDGQFRMMAPVGMVVGFVLYFHSLGRLVLAFSQYIAFFLRAGLAYLTALLLFPPRGLLWLWRHTLGALFSKLWRRYRTARARRIDSKMQEKLKMAAEHGWIEPVKEKGKVSEHERQHKKDHDRIAVRPRVSGSSSDTFAGLLHHKTDAVQQIGAGDRGTREKDRRRRRTGGRSAT